MRNLKNGEDLISQAIGFYLESCKGIMIPDTPVITMCLIGKTHIQLINKSGEIAKIRFDKSHLYLKLENPVSGGRHIFGKLISPVVKTLPESEIVDNRHKKTLLKSEIKWLDGSK